MPTTGRTASMPADCGCAPRSIPSCRRGPERAARWPARAIARAGLVAWAGRAAQDRGGTTGRTELVTSEPLRSAIELADRRGRSRQAAATTARSGFAGRQHRAAAGRCPQAMKPGDVIAAAPAGGGWAAADRARGFGRHGGGRHAAERARAGDAGRVRRRGWARSTAPRRPVASRARRSSRSSMPPRSITALTPASMVLDGTFCVVSRARRWARSASATSAGEGHRGATRCAGGWSNRAT